jgi:hypothetical protein
MHRTRLIIGLILGLSAFGLAATVYDGGLGRFYGDTVLTNLHTGAVYFNTASNTFWVGGVSSNPVKVGVEGVATTNDINTAVGSLASTTFVNNAVAPLADTNYVNNAVSGLTTNLGLLDLSTNACTLYVTNGLIKGVTTP